MAKPPTPLFAGGCFGAALVKKRILPALVIVLAACGSGAGATSSGSGKSDAAAPVTTTTTTTTTTTSAAPPAEEAGAPEASAEPAKPPGKCPEVTSPDRAVSFDWSKELGVDAPLAARLRGVSGTAVEIHLLSIQAEADLRLACSGIAAELGSKGAFANAQVACQAAVDAIKSTRTKLSKEAKVAVHMHPAICPEMIDDAKECGKRCSGEDSPPEATCGGVTAGRCPGTCDGACELRAPGTCDGTCLGACDTGFTGTCDGTCKGKCDGKDLKTPGECRGKCEGSCDAVGKGQCKGRCAGGCQLKAAACAGVCMGRCSVPVQAPQCLGSVKLATGPECASYCDVRALHRTACGAAQVDVRITNAKDEAAAKAYTGSIERHLPAVLKIEHQLKGRLDSLNKAKTAVSDGLKAITAAGGPAMPTLSSCLFSYDAATSEGVKNLFATFRSAADVAGAARAK